MLKAGLHPSLILLDVRMPLMDGCDVLNVIQRDPDLAEIPVALMTAGPERDLAPGALLLRKPLDFDTVIGLVSEHCGRPPELDLRDSRPA